MNVYKVTYKTSWENETVYEKMSLNILAFDAENAIEKAKQFNNKETYTDDEEKYHRDVFELIEVELLVEDVHL